jgi:hypothetical protein
LLFVKQMIQPMEVRAYLTHLPVKEDVASSTQNQALSALTGKRSAFARCAATPIKLPVEDLLPGAKDFGEPSA